MLPRSSLLHHRRVAQGIIHRDIKPEHVLFNSEKVVKLSGFFLAQVRLLTGPPTNHHAKAKAKQERPDTPPTLAPTPPGPRRT